MQIGKSCSVRIDSENGSVTVGAAGASRSVKCVTDQQYRRGWSTSVAIGKLAGRPAVSWEGERIDQRKIRRFDCRRKKQNVQREQRQFMNGLKAPWIVKFVHSSASF